METSSPPIDLPSHLYYQLVHTLIDLLPPPLDDTQAALHARNHAAIAKVAAMLPVNANEADLAAQCISARAQAEDMLRLLRRHPNDIRLIIGLNAQYSSMLRTSLSVHAHLMKVQAQRHKREANDTAANQDAWTQHVAERSMLAVVNPHADLPAPTWPTATPEAAPVATPITALATHINQIIPKTIPAHDTNSHDTAFETPLSKHLADQEPNGMDASLPKPASPQTTPTETLPADGNQRNPQNVSGYEMNTRDAAFETWLNTQSWYRRLKGSSEMDLRKAAREAIAKAHLRDQGLPKNAHESPAKAA